MGSWVGPVDTSAQSTIFGVDAPWVHTFWIIPAWIIGAVERERIAFDEHSPYAKGGPKSFRKSLIGPLDVISPADIYPTL